MEQILATAGDYGAKVREALHAVDTRTASQYWREYVCWYQALLDSGRMGLDDFKAIDSAYKDAEEGRSLVHQD